MPNKKAQKRTYPKKRREFGCIRELPSKNFRADYLGPDHRRHRAPHTFQMKKHARTWLDNEKKLIDKGKWTSPAERAMKAAAKEAKRSARKSRSGITLASYGRKWLKEHELADTTRALYSRYLEALVYPRLGDRPLSELKRSDIDEWHRWAVSTASKRRPRETAYVALSSMLSSARDARLIKKNPCRVKRAVQSHSDRPGKTLTPAQIASVAQALASPADTAAIRAEVRAALASARAELTRNKRLTEEERQTELNRVRRDAKRSAMVTHGIGRPEWVALAMLACFCGLRTGELQELRRRDVSLADGIVDINHASRFLRPIKIGGEVVNTHDGSNLVTGGRWQGGAPVKAQGERPVPLAPHLAQMLQHHLDTYVDPEPDALLFPPIRWTKLTAEQKRNASVAQRSLRLPSTTVFEYWKAALERAGAPDIHFHDLRHTSASLFMQSGATLKEVMELLGHRDPRTALNYQHGNPERHQEIAAKVSERALQSGDLAA